MSLYNLVHGMNPAAPIALRALDLGPDDFMRFRDAFITDKDEIAVYTRLGGANRQDYLDVFEHMREHPNYLRDEDASHDSTYATFFFSLPERYAESLRLLSTGEFDPAKEFEKALERIKEGDPEVMKRVQPLAEQLKQAVDGTHPTGIIEI